MPELKITILVENTVGVPAGVIGEWGLAMLLDFGDEKILIDTGEQGNIVGNAGTLGIDLHQIDRVVLSHGHYDHTGGLIEFLKERGKVPVYAHPEIFSGHYGPVFNGAGNKYIGVPFRLEQLASAGAEFLLSLSCWHPTTVQGCPWPGGLPRNSPRSFVGLV